MVKADIIILGLQTDRCSYGMYGDRIRNRITDSLVSLLDQLLHEDHGKFKATEYVGTNMTIVRGIDYEALSNRNIEYAAFCSSKNREDAEEVMINLSIAFGAHLSQAARGIPNDFTCISLGKELLVYSLDKLDLRNQLTQFKDR